ncbi:hypothetical protein ElyMa_004046000 [Elysia marginata]|uniref:Uncharacterized protein n=1 Tax=Elysia marginata TaxID=1093978 RepID=A0AAV4G5G8_9GAST|nr:hypothetical protein ElyMa_004046000 [Elysia marginata]
MYRPPTTPHLQLSLWSPHLSLPQQASDKPVSSRAASTTAWCVSPDPAWRDDLALPPPVTESALYTFNLGEDAHGLSPRKSLPWASAKFTLLAVNIFRPVLCVWCNVVRAPPRYRNKTLDLD